MTAHRPLRCPACGFAPHRIARVKNRAGVDMLFWQCMACQPSRPTTGDDSGGPWVPRSELQRLGVGLSGVPLVDVAEQVACTRCGRLGAELHHYAPRAFFGDDCENWAKEPLCRGCHMLWHRTVTPGLVLELAPQTESGTTTVLDIW